MRSWIRGSRSNSVFSPLNPRRTFLLATNYCARGFACTAFFQWGRCRRQRGSSCLNTLYFPCRPIQKTRGSHRPPRAPVPEGTGGICSFYSANRPVCLGFSSFSIIIPVTTVHLSSLPPSVMDVWPPSACPLPWASLPFFIFRFASAAFFLVFFGHRDSTGLQVLIV